MTSGPNVSDDVIHVYLVQALVIPMPIPWVWIILARLLISGLWNRLRDRCLEPAHEG